MIPGRDANIKNGEVTASLQHTVTNVITPLTEIGLEALKSEIILQLYGQQKSF